MNKYPDGYAPPASPQDLRERFAAGERWFYEATLAGSDLTSINLSDANLERATFEGAILFKATMRGCVLFRADFRNADLRRANLVRCALYSTKFYGADLRGANFSGANMHGVLMTRAQYDLRTRWPRGFDPKRLGAILVSR